MKTGRNDPCPCGSGKKYKHCCLSVARAVNDELSDLLSEQEFDSIEGMQAATDTLVAKQNQKGKMIFLDCLLNKFIECLILPMTHLSFFSLLSNYP